MNAPSKIEAATLASARLADAMEAEGIYTIRRHLALDGFTIELCDGRRGWGLTPREAINAARAKPSLPRAA